MKIGLGILGGTGYGAAELLRLLSLHPQTEVVSVVSRSAGGARVDKAHPQLSGFYELAFDSELDIDALAEYQAAAVFSALPHGTSAAVLLDLLPKLKERQIKVIDLSGDFRLRSPEAHARYYPHSPAAQDVRTQFRYGLPELFREQIQCCDLVANPGCLATAAALAAAPLLALSPSGQLAIDAKTGSSGSGKEPKAGTHHPTRHGNFRAYKPLAHQHEPELLETLQRTAAEVPPLSFLAQSIPVSRGIFVSVHAQLAKATTTEALLEHIGEFYRGAPFIRLREEMPEINPVAGTNFCDISAAARGKQAIICTTLDNLVKGMAGQAIQNMNLMFELEERCGLMQPALGPC